MLNVITQYWPYIVALAGVLFLVVPRLGLGSVGQWFSGLVGHGKPTQHQLVDAYRRLADNLRDKDAQQALTTHVWPAIGGYREGK